MKEYDLIIIGTGSGMNIVNGFLRKNPNAKIAVIDKDEPGGICLTRGCIPTKIILYPAEIIRIAEHGKSLGVDVRFENIDFKFIMNRMRHLINRDIEQIRVGLNSADFIDYYQEVATFVGPYALKVGNETITSKFIVLCTGSRPRIPPIKNIKDVGFLTSRTALKLEELPESLIIVGGGYIAAEFGHFFSAMGSKVTIVGRNPQFLPQEEPEISRLALIELGKHVTIITGYEVIAAEKTNDGKKKIIAKNRSKSNDVIELEAQEIMIAAGRISNSDLLQPEKGGIEVDENGWIVVNEYLETTKPGIWCIGDANGKHLFKHVANYESEVLYYNAILGKKVPVDYYAVPHAVFTYPEIAGVGMKESEAIEKHGEDKIVIGFQKYEDTGKGEAMGVRDYFVKIILEERENKILGAHIIGPHASILIQEVINLMYTPSQSANPIYAGMHIHPALNEVVQRAFYNVMSVEQYHHLLRHNGLE